MRRRVNFIGVVAAALMLLLVSDRNPPWWRFDVGGVAVLNASPFKLSFNVAGSNVLPPVVEYLTLGAWLAMIAGALLVLAGSMCTRPWSRGLVSFGLSKIAWELGALVIVMLLIYLAAGPVLGPLLMGRAGIEVIEAQVPLMAGQGALKLGVAQPLGGALITIPIASELTQRFYLALAALITCIAARIYQGRLVEVRSTSRAS